MINDLSIVIIGYDKDKDVWPLTNQMWINHWSDCPFESIFVSVNEKNSPSAYVKTLITNGKEDYSDRLLLALKNIKTKYVLLLLHDFGLCNTPDDQLLIECCNFMNGNNYRFCQLGTQYGSKLYKGKKIKGTNFSDIKNIPYRINLQPAIWEKDFLLEIASSISMNGAFEFEAFLNQKQGKKLSKQKACFLNNYHFPIIDVIEKGNISFLANEYIKTSNISFKTQRNIQNQEEFEKSKKKFISYMKTPNFIINIARLLKRDKSYANRKLKSNDDVVIISGANGFIGSLLVKKFFDQGYRVVSILQKDNDCNLDFIEKHSHRIIRTNFDNSNFKIELPKNAACFIHLAWSGVNGPSKGDESVQTNNIKMAIYAAEAAYYAGTKRFIGIGTITELSYLSSGSGIASPSLIYGKYKYQCFEELKKYFKDKKTSFVWLRLSNLYGITNKTGSILNYEISTLLKGEEPEFGPCNQYYDFLLVDDAIEAVFRFVSLSKVHNDEYIIGSGRPEKLSYFLSFISNLIPNSKIHIGVRKDDGMVFLKDFFIIDQTVNEIGNYVSDTFENNMVKLINKVMEDERK